jgi:hypothetical protein
VTLGQRLRAIHASLTEGGVEHAFGGAIALAYWTEEPRGTRDIDVNVFVAPADCERVLAALPEGVSYEKSDVEALKRAGQRRLWWNDTPVDFFFSHLPIHDDAARHRRTVPFEGEQIPVLGPVELAVFKAMFDRTRDWADIEEMLTAQTLDVDALRAQLIRLVGDDDQRLVRLNDALERAASDASTLPPA